MKSDDTVALDILVIEDDELQRKAIHGMLTGWGHRTSACDSLAEGNRLLAEDEFDLVFLDMKLPDGDGIEFLSQKVAEHVHASIVIMTAFADVKTAVKAIKHGAYDYLPKPFEPEHLKKILRNLSERVRLSRNITSLTRTTIGSYNNVWQFGDMIGTEVMKGIFEKAHKIASRSDSTVLILGESGTGKGMLAKMVHRMSRRADKPFVDINCSAIPAQLVESEIFGYEKGAFTDAKNRKPGLLELADGGTVFLDEIGDMEVNLQSKLLKVIEDKEFRCLGGSRTTRVDVRIIAATSRDLKVLSREGRFREDLFYRLSVVPITLPPLREHRDAILPLAQSYLGAFCREMGREISGFSPQAEEALRTYRWPGNIRELRNVVERSVILTAGNKIEADVLGLGELSGGAESSASATSSVAEDAHIETLADGEKRLILAALQRANGNKNHAAEILAIHRTTLYKKIEEYGLKDR